MAEEFNNHRKLKLRGRGIDLTVFNATDYVGCRVYITQTVGESFEEISSFSVVSLSATHTLLRLHTIVFKHGSYYTVKDQYFFFVWRFIAKLAERYQPNPLFNISRHDDVSWKSTSFWEGLSIEKGI